MDVINMLSVMKNDQSRQYCVFYSFSHEKCFSLYFSHFFSFLRVNASCHFTRVPP